MLHIGLYPPVECSTKYAGRPLRAREDKRAVRVSRPVSHDGAAPYSPHYSQCLGSDYGRCFRQQPLQWAPNCLRLELATPHTHRSIVPGENQNRPSSLRYRESAPNQSNRDCHTCDEWTVPVCTCSTAHFPSSKLAAQITLRRPPSWQISGKGIRQQGLSQRPGRGPLLQPPLRCRPSAR